VHFGTLSFSEIITHVTSWGYWGAAASLFVEGLSIPFPGGTFLLFYGFLSSQGKISLPLAILSASIGYTLAGTFPYYIGKIGGRTLLLNYGPYVGFSNNSFANTEKWFNKFGIHMVAFGRLMFFRNYVSYFAGIARMPALSFYLFTWLGILPWVIYMTLLGYLLGNNWRYALILIDKYSWIGAVAALLLLFLTILFFRSRIHLKIMKFFFKKSEEE
jgi:membrane protein DedA with SNARE-associated domain